MQGSGGRSGQTIGSVIVAVIVIALVLISRQGSAPAPATTVDQPARATATIQQRSRTIPPTWTPDYRTAPADGLPTIAFNQLPPQAQRTIRLIQQGGPFPYAQDGTIFVNRERLLPDQPPGYYREYTVVTPGSEDRGARRVIAGRNGELYYTDDHYATFARVR